MHRSRKPRGTVMRNVRRQGARPEMADEQMVELYLDVAEACHREAGIAIERVIGLGIVITTWPRSISATQKVWPNFIPWRG